MSGKNDNNKNSNNKNNKITNCDTKRDTNKKTNNRNKNANKNRNRNRNKSGKELNLSVVDTVILLYLLYISTFFLIYMHDMYFDITKTRAECFLYGSAVFVGLAVVAYAFEMTFHSMLVFDKVNRKVSRKGIADYFGGWKEEETRLWLNPRFWAFLFIISQAAAAFVNLIFASKDDKIYKGLKSAIIGDRGRHLGLMMMLVVFVVFMIISYKVKSVSSIYPVLLVVSIYMFYIAVVQHFGTDFKGWRKEIKASQKTIFMSTIGNMNTFGSYLCIFLGISIAAFIFTNKMFYRITSGAGIFAAAFTVMTAKSDNVYLGTAVSLVILFYIAVKRKRLMEWALAILLMAGGLFTMSVLDKVKSGSKGHLNGVASLVGNPKIMGIFLAVAVALFTVLLLLKLLKKELYEGFQNKKLMIGVTIAGVVGVIAVVILGISSNNELFTFNDRWGEFRGYIWKRSARVFGKANLRNKVFGHGNETVRDIMLTYYRKEMPEVTRKVYDSSHNVILQRLLTVGLFGCIAYLGLVFTSIRYMIKNAAGNPEIIACASAAAAYFAEAMVDPEQSVTTPLFYVVLAVGVGLARYRRIKAKND